MRIEEALVKARSELKIHESGANVARNLMLFHFKVSQNELFLNLKNELQDESGYFALIERFKDGEPLEYITGLASFYSLEFDVLSGVLVPRPETEILVEKVLELSKEFDNPKIAEIGTGSGIISVCLALNLDTSIVATDISEIALKNAKQNALKFNVADKIKFVKTEFLNTADEKFDIIVSNPPYIANDYKLDKWVLNEPKTALFGGEKGDEILKDIVRIASQKGVRYLACEMGYDQKKAMGECLKFYGFSAEFYTDLAGFDRGFIAKNLNKTKGEV
ncbi:peptide chain release factor N(5)-glutamine methyltransferase [Campylobacter californiensis]|uniref:peptide chain release factor N(5)-glutamine methyltransferase n=1 Tax=Campylobacter californiensis TaxID=1032243 RepID=UPI0014729263|nr:peptide chain release factor N(5)-glutamine methyltransferase [Campylobacter sp. RM12916]MBE3609064.1 peptide chain release factor N(5)-glutamine methyltransferase [Campylobacter sp. RM12916]